MSSEDEINNFNSLFTQLQNVLACGPVCQQKKTEDSLKEKYLNAQTNLLSAPNQIDDAEKNYITFSQGESAYDELFEAKLQKEAEQNANNFKDFQDVQIKNIQQKLSSYEGLLLNYKNIADLYLKYKNENVELETHIRKSSNDILTSERKTYYQDQQSDSLKFYYYYIFFTIYNICVICFGIFSFIYPSQTDWKIRLATFIGLILLPFVSTWILGLFIYIIYAIYGILPKNVYREELYPKK